MIPFNLWDVVRFLVIGSLKVLVGLYIIYGFLFALLGSLVMWASFADSSINGEVIESISISIPTTSLQVKRTVQAWLIVTPAMIVYFLELWKIAPYIYRKIRR